MNFEHRTNSFLLSGGIDDDAIEHLTMSTWSYHK